MKGDIPAIGPFPAVKKADVDPARAAQETQPLSRGPSRQDARRPLYEEEPFSRQLLSNLEGVPGVPMQMIRILRRGDWRVRG